MPVKPTSVPLFPPLRESLGAQGFGLSNSYLEMKEKPTESVKDSLRDIENTMDIVIDAFMKILDNIYQEKIMDLSSDMSVLKSMLKQEGLLDKDEFKIGR